MTDDELLLSLNAAAQTLDGMADELLHNGQDLEGNDYLTERDAVLRMAMGKVMEHGDVSGRCFECGKYTWTPEPRYGMADDWVCWTCRDRREREPRPRHEDAIAQVVDKFEALDAAADDAEADL